MMKDVDFKLLRGFDYGIGQMHAWTDNAGC